MLVLRKDKEEELVSKYGFIKEENSKGGIWYIYGKRFTIYGCDSVYKPRRIDSTNSMSMEVQDLFYRLIKEDVLVVEDSKYYTRTDLN